MDKNYQYYSNRNPQGHSNKGFGNSPCVGPITNDRNFDYLLRKNFLSGWKLKISCFAVVVTRCKTVIYSYFFSYMSPKLILSTSYSIPIP